MKRRQFKCIEAGLRRGFGKVLLNQYIREIFHLTDSPRRNVKWLESLTLAIVLEPYAMRIMKFRGRFSNGLVYLQFGYLDLENSQVSDPPPIFSTVRSLLRAWTSPKRPEGPPTMSEIQSNPGSQAFLSRWESGALQFSRLAALFSIVVGCLVTLGWCLHVPILTVSMPGSVPVALTTALAFMSCGVSLSLLTLSQVNRWTRLGTIVFGLMPLALAATIMMRYLHVTSFDLDAVIFRALTNGEVGEIVGRMAPHTSIGLVAGSLALLFCRIENEWHGTWRKHFQSLYLVSVSRLSADIHMVRHYFIVSEVTHQWRCRLVLHFLCWEWECFSHDRQLVWQA